MKHFKDLQKGDILIHKYGKSEFFTCGKEYVVMKEPYCVDDEWRIQTSSDIEYCPHIMSELYFVGRFIIKDDISLEDRDMVFKILEYHKDIADICHVSDGDCENCIVEKQRAELHQDRDTASCYTINMLYKTVGINCPKEIFKLLKESYTGQCAKYTDCIGCPFSELKSKTGVPRGCFEIYMSYALLNDVEEV